MGLQLVTVLLVWIGLALVCAIAIGAAWCARRRGWLAAPRPGGRPTGAADGEGLVDLAPWQPRDWHGMRRSGLDGFPGDFAGGAGATAPGERSDGYEGWLEEPPWRGDEPEPYPSLGF